jgi:hypothetical protein
MIARISDKSFFGIPPAPVAPEAATESKTAPPAPMTNPVTHPASQPLPGRYDIVANREPLGLFAGSNEDESEDTPVHPPTRNSPVNVDTPHRRPQARSSQRRQGLQNIDAADPLAWDQDERTWQTWHEQELPAAFSRLSPQRGTRSLVWKAPVIYCTTQPPEQY